uniref:Myosin, light chain kinase 5 n=1 Tax=Periophthalmus magnuspinnatus TaxID=409849 RepID=A0A3B3Z9C0_9GOBI
RMDKGAKEIFVSTFRLALKPRVGFFSSDKAKENGVEAENKKPGSATGNTLKAETPEFKEWLQDCVVCEGTDASFQAVISGSGPLTVSWTHNGEYLSSTTVRSQKTSFHNGVATLALNNCSFADAGSYSCVVENTAGRQTSTAALYVTGKLLVIRFIIIGESSPFLPLNEWDSSLTRSATTKKQEHLEPKVGRPVVFVDAPDKVEVRIGEKARLHCVFKSVSVPVACCWVYNKDKVVLGGTRISFRSSESQSSVEISQACPEDQGCYTIVVRNRQGFAHHTVTLSVIDRPDPPASHPVVSKLTSDSLVLSWTGPSYDGGTAVLGYIVEPQGQYRFRVRAFNSIGISAPSQQSDCIKMASEKEVLKYVDVTVDTKNKVKDHYDVHEKLGVGKFGQVYRMTHKESGDICAGKFYRSRTSKDKAAALKEIELMNCLHHPKLVQCLAAYDTRPEIVMVMEYIPGGELFARIVDDNFEHTEPTSARYMQQILEGMQYVHKQNIVHLDLKPENIVCVDTTGTNIKIIDFGLASKLDDDKPLLVMHGTPEFVAPEVISYEPVSLETDMWSIGVICYVLLSGESPFQGNNDAETFAFVTAAKFEFDEESFEDISDEAKDFISLLLKKDPRDRLSCADALAHPWMASFTPLLRRPTKSLNKTKMRRFLAKRKWRKAGKAVLALKRMANLSNRPDSPGSSSEGKSDKAPTYTQLHTMVSCPGAVAYGRVTQFQIVTSSYPELQVKWLQNEKEILESSRVTKEINKDGVCSLVLINVKPSDSGVYVCRASNKVGEAMCSAKLTVTH